MNTKMRSLPAVVAILLLAAGCNNEDDPSTGDTGADTTSDAAGDVGEGTPVDDTGDDATQDTTPDTTQDAEEDATDAGEDVDPLVCDPDCACGADEVCDFTCDEGCEMVECLGGDCSADCTEGDCAMDCDLGATCEYGCTGGGCVFDCDLGAECDIDCAGGGCEVVCDADTVCNVTCGGDEPCDVTCENGGVLESCEGDCEIAGCDVCDPVADLDTTYMPEIIPSNFVEVIDNPLMPWLPGARWVYENPDETIEVYVTEDTREILGITCTVVRDTVTITDTGDLVEVTDDWYAQDVDGNVWYMGEDSAEYEGGVPVSTHGSWEAGVDGAQPGIVMFAAPEVGTVYRQEYLVCEAEDMAEILALAEDVTVPFGSFTGCLQTEDYTPLEPNVLEHKYYCPGVGQVLEVDPETGEREELIEFTAGTAP